MLSSIPSDSLPEVETGLPVDKVIHFVEYGILGFLLFRFMFSSLRMSAKWSVVLAICCAAALGAIDESYQSLTGRDSSLYDWIADCLGAVVVSLCCLSWYTRVQESMRVKRNRNFRG